MVAPVSDGGQGSATKGWAMDVPAPRLTGGTHVG